MRLLALLSLHLQTVSHLFQDRAMAVLVYFDALLKFTTCICAFVLKTLSTWYTCESRNISSLCRFACLVGWRQKHFFCMQICLFGWVNQETFLLYAADIYLFGWVKTCSQLTICSISPPSSSTSSTFIGVLHCQHNPSTCDRCHLFGLGNNFMKLWWIFSLFISASDRLFVAEQKKKKKRKKEN